MYLKSSVFINKVASQNFSDNKLFSKYPFISFFPILQTLEKPLGKRFSLLISLLWSLSIPSENKRKPLQGVLKGIRMMKWFNMKA